MRIPYRIRIRYGYARDTARTRIHAVSAYPSLVGPETHIGNVSAHYWIRPSPTNQLPVAFDLPDCRPRPLPAPSRLPHAAATRTRRPDSPPAGDRPPPSPATILRPRRRRGDPATATRSPASGLQAPATSPLVSAYALPPGSDARAGEPRGALGAPVLGVMRGFGAAASADLVAGFA